MRAENINLNFNAKPEYEKLSFYEILHLRNSLYYSHSNNESPKVGPVSINSKASFGNIKDVITSQQATRYSNTNKKNLVINDEDCSFLGIIVNKSIKEEVVEILKNYSLAYTNKSDTGIIYNYEDLGITITFDYQNVVKEITFKNNFKGKTLKNIQINDEVNKAITIYGEPLYKKDSLLCWGNFCIFHKDGIIQYIRLQRYIF